MRNRMITFTLLGATLLLYIAYFSVLKIAFPLGQPIVSQLEEIIGYARQDQWEEAGASADKLLVSWERSKYLLAFNYAEEDYSLFLDNLARMQGAIKTRDATETVSQATATLKLWNHFNKIIPLP